MLKTPILWGLRQKQMIPPCCPWKIVTFFGKEHVNWSSISGVTLGRSWTIKFIIFLVTPILSFPKLIFELLPIITPLLLGQLTCSLPKNVTIFHGEQDEIIHFCFSPHKRDVSSHHNFIHIWPNAMFFTKKCNYFSQGRR